MSAIQQLTYEPRTAPLHECPLCGSNEHRKLFSSIDRLHGVPGTYSYDKCAECGSVFQNPMVIEEDLHLCYPKDYSPYDFDPEIPDVQFDDAGGNSFRDRLRKDIVHAVWNEPSSAAGRLLSKSRWFRERAFYGIVPDECLPDARGKYFALDVGCGSGWMLKRLAKVGWEAEGIEWDEAAAELARQRTGANVWAGDFRNIDMPPGRYKLIFLSHVFEHLYEPLEALGRFHELLADGGRLVMFWPNCNSYDAKWFDQFWFHWDAPRHLIFPTTEIVTKRASQIGFGSCAIRSTAARWVWQNSKAYSHGHRPTESLPRLNSAELRGYRRQLMSILQGAIVGSEISATLHKI